MLLLETPGSILWASMALLLCLNMLVMWRVSLSRRWKRFFRPSAAPMGIIIFASPFIDQPRIAGIIPCRVAGAAIAFVGLSLCVLALGEFRKFGLSVGALVRRELRKPGIRPEAAAPHRLVTSGPYGVVRHPQMLGFAIFYVGYSLFFGSVYCLCWLPLVIGIVFAAASIEERDLQEEFGREYEEYRRRVGMFLPKIPGR